VEVAEAYARAEHVIRYQQGNPGVAHLVAHELGHLDLIAEARKAGGNRQVVTSEAERARFVEDNRRTFEGLQKKGIDARSAEGFIGALFSGLVLQAYNAPIDLFIEASLFERIPELRPVQFLSLFRLQQQYQQAAKDRSIVAHTPQKVYYANLVYNLTHALQFKELFGLDLTGEYRTDKRTLAEAQRLYDEFVEVRDSRSPGEEYEFVADWAEDMGIASYLSLRPEERPGEAITGDATDPLSRAAADPYNLDDPARREAEGNRVSFKDSPAGAMAVTMYLLDALKLFDGQPRQFVEQVGFEVAMLGNHGLNPGDAETKYSLRTVPGRKFSALHLLAYMYASFRELDPSLDSGLDFADEYATAKAMHEGERH
jgi:hypothetical protein